MINYACMKLPLTSASSRDIVASFIESNIRLLKAGKSARFKTLAGKQHNASAVNQNFTSHLKVRYIVQGKIQLMLKLANLLFEHPPSVNYISETRSELYNPLCNELHFTFSGEYLCLFIYTVWVIRVSFV